MNILLNDPGWHRWLCEAIGIRLHLDQSSSIMFFNDNHSPLGGFIFERYTGKGGSMHVHFAGACPGWLSRRVLQVVAKYVYIDADCDVLFGEVNSKDVDVCSIDERIGFTRHAVIENYFPDSDLIVYRMFREDCRWLPRRRPTGG